MSDKLTYSDWRVIEDTVENMDHEDRKRLSRLLRNHRYESERVATLLENYRSVLKNEMR